MRIVFGVGIGKDKNGADIPYVVANDAKRTAASYLSTTFGGCTVVQGDGYWVDLATSQLVTENALQFIVDSATDYSPSLIKVVAGYLCVLFNQSTVLVSIQQSEVSFI